MTITFLDLYNDMTGQAWSMFDGDAEGIDDFEKSVTTSIQKALNDLWCSYKFPFRNKTMTVKTRSGVNSYSTPNGKIAKKKVNNKQVYGVKIGKNFLEYEPNFEFLEDESGTPEKFYVKNDKLYLYPTPDDIYKVEIEYWTIFAACDEDGASKATLKEETDYIDIPEKYEVLFKAALLPLCMVYAIASDSDENHSGYQRQYEDAYKILIDYARGIETEKRIGWR